VSNAGIPLRNLATAHHITPQKPCRRCKQRTGNWTTGHDDGTDPNYVGYQCQNCGYVESLTRGTILRQVRNEQEDSQ
jgi:hypothetical protein